MLTGNSITVHEVAARAGVSIATVSRVTHGKPVRPGVRERVLAAMSELNYSPNFAARALRTNSTKTIGCVFRGLLLPEMAPFVRAAEEVFRDAGYTILLSGTEEDAEKQRQLLLTLTSRGVDGILLTAATDRQELIQPVLAQSGVPVVLIDRDAPLVADMVTVDHGTGIRAAVDYLVSLGHHKIALLSVSEKLRPGRERIAAFREAVQHHGIDTEPRLVLEGCENNDRAFQNASALFTSSHRPTAVICGGMAVLPLVLRAAKLHRLRVPDDISIIAGCDSELAELTVPAITTVRWDIAEWGRLSAQLLLDRLKNGQAHETQHLVVPTELVVRSSCAAPPR